MKLCGELAAHRKQLKKLQVAYREHLMGQGRERLKWMERSIDMQQEAVVKLQRVRDEMIPFGCMGCRARRECPHTAALQAASRVTAR